MKKSTIFSFISGILFSVIVYVAFSLVSISKETVSDQSDLPFGVKVEYGNGARKASSVAGVLIPENATDCFYCIAGLKPVFEYVAFSVPKNNLWKVVNKITKTNKREFTLKDQAGYPLVFSGPETFGQRYKTILYDLPSPDILKTQFLLPGGVISECCVDPVTSRIFIKIISND